MQTPNGQPTTPTIGPLRITKRELEAASTPPPTGTLSSSTRAQLSGPSSAQHPAPSSSPPIQGSPYPDNRLRQQAVDGQQVYTPLPEKERTRRSEPQAGIGERRRMSSGTRLPFQPSISPRPRFDGGDPNRPSVTGYAGVPRTEPATDPLMQDHQSTAAAVEVGSSMADPPRQHKAYRADNYPLNPMATTSSHASATSLDYRRQESPASEHGSSIRPGAAESLDIPNLRGVSRLDSTASTSTTRASRGSPPPLKHPWRQIRTTIFRLSFLPQV